MKELRIMGIHMHLKIDTLRLEMQIMLLERTPTKLKKKKPITIIMEETTVSMEIELQGKATPSKYKSSRDLSRITFQDKLGLKRTVLTSLSAHQRTNKIVKRK